MRTSDERGVALIASLLVMLLMSALLVGMTASVMSDQRFRGNDRDRLRAFYAAHAGLEKLTADLGNYFQTNYAPTAAQVSGLTNVAPALPGVSFAAAGGGTGYSVSWALSDNQGNPKAAAVNISSGPYQGLIALLTKYTMDVTAHTSFGGETHLRRDLETVAIPVFQFGMFSDTDLSFFPGPAFNFGGRVHTNGNLFLASGTGPITLADKVTAVGEIIRTHLSNGAPIGQASAHNGPVSMMKAPGAFRDLASNEGSLTGFLGSAANPSWTNISLTTYNGYIRNWKTGAKALSLPVLTAGGSNPDIVRRPASANENVTNAILFGERYFSKASLRILLSDTAADIQNLPTVTQGTQPISLEPAAWPPVGYNVDATHPRIAASPGAQVATTNANTPNGTASQIAVAAMPAFFQIPATIVVGANPAVVCTGRTATTLTGCSGFVAAVAAGAGTAVSGSVNSGAGTIAVGTTTAAAQAAIAIGQVNRTLTVASTSAFAPTTFWLGGQIVSCSGYDTTPRFTGCTNVPATNSPATISTNALSSAGTGTVGGWIKIELQDNAGTWRDVTLEILNYGIGAPNPTNATGSVACADPTPNAILRIQRLKDNSGTCNYAGSLNANDYWPNILFDPREGLQRDVAAAAIVMGGVMHYISLDARNLSSWLTGAGAYAAGSGTLALNNNGTGYAVYFSDRRNNRNAVSQETGEYGNEDTVNPAVAAGGANGILDAAEDVNANAILDTYGQFPNYNGVAQAAVPGAILPLTAAARPTTTVTAGQAQTNRAIFFRHALKLVNGSLGNIVAPGLAIIAENPVYIQGDWNASVAAGWGNPHVATSVAADAVTLLSNNWNDDNSFANPYNPGARTRTDTYYRVAIIGGKNPSFAWPAWGPESDFGTDGGAHNFLRYLESGGSLFYKGSLASFYYSRQATGIYKCCTTVYGAPTRGYSFDIDFLTPSLLPPLTPVFRDVNTLGFSQEIRPGK